MTLNMQTTTTASAGDVLRVMVVDDSAVIRGFLSRFIEEDKGLKVVASVSNGQLALNTLERTQVDVVVLDIEMPVMDGLTTLPRILKMDPNLQVIIASTLTKENAQITMRCFQAGAAECLAKPTSSELAGSNAFKQSLLEKVRELGKVTRKKRALSPASTQPRSAGSNTGAAAVNTPVITAAAPVKKFSLRNEIVKTMPDIVAVGSSTGGPQALMQFFTDLKTPIKQPILITQHMPPTFTAILAEHISKQSGLKCKEGAEGDVIEGGKIYIAPGNYHMIVKEVAGKRVISLNQEPPENFCRPSVDPMLRSIINIYGKKVLAVIFTGMGSDGLKSCQKLVESGGTVLAQDEATSVVWGMPGAVAMAGVCTQVLPLGLMAKAVRDYTDRIGAP